MQINLELSVLQLNITALIMNYAKIKNTFLILYKNAISLQTSYFSRNDLGLDMLSTINILLLNYVQRYSYKYIHQTADNINVPLYTEHKLLQPDVNTFF